MLRETLKVMLSGQSPVSYTGHATSDDNDGFEPIRTAANSRPTDASNRHEIFSSRCAMETCIAFLTVGPTLQSASGEPTRDKILTDLILNCAESQPEVFLLVCPILFDQIRRGYVNLSVKNLDSFLDALAGLLQTHTYSLTKRSQLLVVQFLDATLDVWSSRLISIGEVLHKCQGFCDWLSGTLRKQKIRAWSVRDFFARFLDRYLSKDPEQLSWAGSDSIADSPDGLPDALLPMMTSDEDIRVRFRVAALNARLFGLPRHQGRSALDVYSSIKKWYTVDLDKCVSNCIASDLV